MTDAYIFAVIDQAGGLGKHNPMDGHYGVMVIKDLADREEADEYKKSLFRCAHYLTRTNQAPVSISQCDIERDGRRGFKITFRVSDKTMARKFQLENRGTDRSKWTYDPRRRGGTD